MTFRNTGIGLTSITASAWHIRPSINHNINQLNTTIAEL